MISGFEKLLILNFLSCLKNNRTIKKRTKEGRKILQLESYTFMIAGHLLHFFYTVLLWTHDISENANLQKVTQKHFLIKEDTQLSSSVPFYRIKKSCYCFWKIIKFPFDVGIDLTKPFLSSTFRNSHCHKDIIYTREQWQNPNCAVRAVLLSLSIMDLSSQII